MSHGLLENSGTNLLGVGYARVGFEETGVAAGTLWGLSMLVIVLTSAYAGYGASFLRGIASIYPGYAVSLTGGFVGLVYGFLDGFVDLYLIAWLYNFLGKRRL